MGTGLGRASQFEVAAIPIRGLSESARLVRVSFPLICGVDTGDEASLLLSSLRLRT